MYQFFQKIVAVYDTEPDNFPRLMELMQDMQECGQPPSEIIKDLAPGLEFGPDGMPVMVSRVPCQPRDPRAPAAPAPHATNRAPLPCPFVLCACF